MRVAAILGFGSSPRHLKPFAQASDALWQIGLPAEPGDADAILVLGGDGTVHRHLAQLLRLQLPVLVVPRGSGNDFARALGLRSVKDALAAWRQFASPGRVDKTGRGENVRRIDLGLILPLAPAVDSSPRYFGCVAGVGLDSEVARRANRLPRGLRRRGGYLLSLLPALARFTPVAVRVQAWQHGQSAEFEVRHNGPAMLVAAANAAAYGGGMLIAPHALLNDGQLDICVVGAMSRFRLFRLFPSVYSGQHLDIPEVKYFRAERLRIESEIPLAVYADGEYVCDTPLEVTVEPAALKVIVPAG